MKNKRKPEIKIQTNGITGTEIFIDGMKVQGVTGFRFIQSYKKNRGLPTLQIDLKATNVTLETKILPDLPAPFDSHYISIAEILESGRMTKDDLNELFKATGRTLEIV